MTHLTKGQRALLEAALQKRLEVLDVRLADHHGGLSRAEHAHAMLSEDVHDARQRESERQLDLSQSDRDTQDIAVASQALARLREGTVYGICTDCDEDIPFARLQAEPWALRCVDCEGLREAARKRGG